LIERASDTVVAAILAMIAHLDMWDIISQSHELNRHRAVAGGVEEIGASRSGWPTG